MTTPEGSSNPYWSDPKEAPERIQRVLAIMRRQPDAKQIAFFVAKSNNDNFVAYRWEDEKSCITPFWISTQNVAAERRDELSFAESMLYGVNLQVAASGEWLVTLNAEALRDKAFHFTLDESGIPSLIGSIDGQDAFLEYAYVQMSKGLIPNVDFVTIYGTSRATGKQVREILQNAVP